MGDRYISNVAKSLIGKFQITWSMAAGFRGGVCAQTLYEHWNLDVRREIAQMRPETMGRIAVQGLPDDEETLRSRKTPLYAVHAGTYLSKYESGRNILVELATTAIIAEMTDQLRSRMESDTALDSDEVRGTQGI